MKAEKPAIVTRIKNRRRRSSPRDRWMMRLPMNVTAPVRKRPAETTRMAATVMSAGLENPATASSGSTSPVRTRATGIKSATRSTGRSSVTHTPEASVTKRRAVSPR